MKVRVECGVFVLLSITTKLGRLSKHAVCLGWGNLVLWIWIMTQSRVSCLSME